MPQFDVYPHPVEEWRSQSPYLLDIQSDHVRGDADTIWSALDYTLHGY